MECAFKPGIYSGTLNTGYEKYGYILILKSSGQLTELTNWTVFGEKMTWKKKNNTSLMSLL